MTQWYARPVLFVADIDRTVSFYVDKLGFTENWRFDENGKAFVVQVGRDGCELIFSNQWPAKNGTGRIFLSLDFDVLEAARKDMEARGVAVREGSWGYRCAIVDDPDGNQLYFAYPKDK